MDAKKTELTLEMVERLARALRDSIYGAAMDAAGWESAKVHWIKDANAFLAHLDRLGLQVIEKKTEKDKTVLAG